MRLIAHRKLPAFPQFFLALVLCLTTAAGNIPRASFNLTKNYTTLGLPSSISGPTFSGSFAQSFATSGFTQTYTGNGHSQSVGVSPSGDWQGSNGYGAPNFNMTAPSFGSTITQTGSTGAGAMTFTKSLAGTLLSRTFPDASSESFTYDANGAVTSWKNARGTTLDFNPNQFGQPTTFGTYASIGYDDAGRVNSITDASGSGTFTYTQDKPANVTYTSGVLAGQFVNRHYDNNGRVTQVDLPGPGLSGTVSIYYGYDSTTGQMSTVTTASGVSGTWSNYDSVSGRAKNFTLGALSVSKTFDGLGRIASETSTAGGISYGYGSYTYDGDGHCTSRTAPEGLWTYYYDSNGYLSEADGGLGNLYYSFDEAGRPSSATGDYYATSRTNAGTVKVFGSVNPSATVTINGTSVTVNGTTGYYGASYTPTRNTWQTYTVTGSLAATGTSASALATDTRNVFVPPATESLNYDGDGNRSADAKWSYTWDDMNRLAKVTLSGTAAASPPVGQATEIDYVYDLQGRRVQKTVTISGTGGTSETRVTTTLWDNMRQVMDVEKNASGAILAQRYYTWGPDVSGSLDGEAGIGGLIETREIKGPAVTVSVPFYDGIGNIVGYVDEASGQTVARFTYGPFAELLSATGPRASSLAFGFQTKVRENETGNIYFVERYYNPSTLMWVSRDPIREDGGVNLYAYCNNDPVGNFDAVGEATILDNAEPIYTVDPENPDLVRVSFELSQLVFHPPNTSYGSFSSSVPSYGWAKTGKMVTVGVFSKSTLSKLVGNQNYANWLSDLRHNENTILANNAEINSLSSLNGVMSIIPGGSSASAFADGHPGRGVAHAAGDVALMVTGGEFLKSVRGLTFLFRSGVIAGTGGLYHTAVDIGGARYDAARAGLNYNGTWGGDLVMLGKNTGESALAGVLLPLAMTRLRLGLSPAGLHRPYIRNWVRDEVEANAFRAPDGRFVDANTRLPTDNPVLGHKPGYEFWRLKEAAEAEGASQELFNETLNNPEFYQIEDKATNASHLYEEQ